MATEEKMKELCQVYTSRYGRTYIGANGRTTVTSRQALRLASSPICLYIPEEDVGECLKILESEEMSQGGPTYAL